MRNMSSRFKKNSDRAYFPMTSVGKEMDKDLHHHPFYPSFPSPNWPTLRTYKHSPRYTPLEKSRICASVTTAMHTQTFDRRHESYALKSDATGIPVPRLEKWGSGLQGAANTENSQKCSLSMRAKGTDYFHVTSNIEERSSLEISSQTQNIITAYASHGPVHPAFSLIEVARHRNALRKRWSSETLLHPVSLVQEQGYF